jgi:hypothetical protein
MTNRFLLFSLLLILAASGCDRCRNPELIDTGDLTPEKLALVPYADGEVVRLKHSAGQVIDYTVSRSTTVETREYSSYCEVLKFRLNTTRLVPVYPVFPITFYIANTDVNYTAFESVVGKYFYYLPKSKDEALTYGTMSDIYINDSLYRDVFMMKTPSYSILPNEIIYVDSLWYNYSSGIIKILMSNKESYIIYE